MARVEQVQEKHRLVGGTQRHYQKEEGRNAWDHAGPLRRRRGSQLEKVEKDTGERIQGAQARVEDMEADLDQAIHRVADAGLPAPEQDAAVALGTVRREAGCEHCFRQTVFVCFFLS